MKSLQKMIAFLLALFLVLPCILAPGYAAEETLPPETQTEDIQTVETLPVETLPVETEPEVLAVTDGNIGSGTPDGTPPVLKSVTLSATEVTIPGTLEIIVDAEDDVSGVEWGSVTFYCEDTGKSLHTSFRNTYWDDETHKECVYPDGLLHGTLQIDQYVETGSFIISYLDLTDAANNSTYYNRDYDYNPLPDAVWDLQFSVVASDTPDGSPPVLSGVSLSASEVTAPGTLEIIVDAEDDVSGVEWGSVTFYCEDTEKSLHTSFRNTYWDDETHKECVYPDGLLHGTLQIDQYVETGSFKISYLDLTDAANNSTYYNRDHDYNPLPDAVWDLSFHVFNTTPDVTTSLSKPDFLEEVKNADSDAYIAADYSGDATMPKEAFEAIAGTDKTIDLISDGITWRFDGSDITEEVKDVDLKVDIQKVEEVSSSEGGAIEDQLQNTTGVVMKFPENGTLPGKATIQVKVDHAMREYLGSDTGLCVYYYNNRTGQLELIAENLTVINDTYVEFEITHCSSYVLTTLTKTVPMFRMYDPNSGEHFYTGAEAERDFLVEAGWHYEGVGFNFPREGNPVYRLYEPVNGEHLYTMDEAEKAKLLSWGWNYEGVAFNSAETDEVPQYRLHNPNAKRGGYHFTGSEDERDLLVSLGWIDQGIGWFSCAN